MASMEWRAASAFVAAIALIAAEPANARSPVCVTRPQIAALVRITLPVVVDAGLTRCVPLLPADAYLVRAAAKLRAEFGNRSGSDPADVRTVMEAFAGTSMPKAIDNAEFGRLFAQGMVDELGLSRISPQGCRDASDILAPLDALPPVDTERFVTSVFVVASRTNRRFRLCEAAAT